MSVVYRLAEGSVRPGWIEQISQLSAKGRTRANSGCTAVELLANAAGHGGRAKIIGAIEGTTDAFQMSSLLAPALLLRFLQRAMLCEVGEAWMTPCGDGADGAGLFDAGHDP